MPSHFDPLDLFRAAVAVVNAQDWGAMRRPTMTRVPLNRLRYGIPLLALALTHHIAAAQPTAAPTKVVGAQGRWWILDDDGKLRSFDGRRAVAQRFGGPARDIARVPNGDLLALISQKKANRAIVMQHLAGGAWREFANLGIDAGDPLIGLAARDSTVVIVTSRALYFARADGSRRQQPIHGLTIPEGLQPAIALTASHDLYVGENAGEFGGGLIRIDIATGLSERVERREKGCEGPLNAHCTPVTAVIPDPTDGRCVIASIGLRHIVLNVGRVLQVCGASVRVLAELPCPGEPAGQHCSLGIFALATDSSTGFWAVSGSTLYHFRADTIDRRESMPKLHSRAGIAYSEAIPGLLVLSTDINWRRSVSGPTPLIGSR